MKTREELQQEIDYLHQKIYYCKVNDLLYDMQKHEYELELLEDELSTYKLTNENINQLIDLNNESKRINSKEIFEQYYNETFKSE